MRSDQVENGVNFLVHPKVKTAPLSQRISFLENKGLTSEEISAALARVEAQEGGDNKSSEGTSFESGTSSNFLIAQQDVPLWRRLVVPGAVALGAVGALGTYQAVARAATSSSDAISGSENLTDYHHQQQASTRMNGDEHASCNGGLGGSHNVARGRDIRSGGEGVDEGLDYAREGVVSRTLDTGTAYDGVMGEGNTGGSGGLGAQTGDSASRLAGEFRRLSEAMEQQTGQLVEAVGAMKSLASRAEQDSSSLLAARVNSHTSELRAELGTIKQLLLLQAGNGPGAAAGAAGSGAGDGGAIAPGGLAGTESSVPVSGNAATGVAEGATTRTSIGSGNVGERTGTAGSPNAIGARNTQGLSANSQTTDAGSTGGKLPAASPKCRGRLNEDGAATGDTAQKSLEQATLIAHRTEAARSALSSLLATNSPQPAKDGIAMLRMLVMNLVKQPNVPRYRRIAASNDNFKKRVLPLEGHRVMMEAIGFKAKGSLWEWTWHEDSDPNTFETNKTVLENVMAAIDAAARPNGPPPPTSASSLTTTWPPQPGFSTTGTTSAGLPAPRGAVGAAPPTPRPPASIAPHTTHGLQVPQSNALEKSVNQHAVAETNGSVWKSVPLPADISGAAAGTGGGDVVSRTLSGRINGEVVGPVGVGKSSPDVSVAAADGERAGDSSTVESSNGRVEDQEHAQRQPLTAVATVSEMKGVSGSGSKDHSVDDEAGGRGNGGGADKEASSPISMAELAAAIQRGDEPPGIRRVEDRLSADASLLASTSSPKLSPPKPWETSSTSQIVSVGAVESANGGVHLGGSGESGEGVGDEGEARLQPPTPSSVPSHSPQQAVSVGP